MMQYINTNHLRFLQTVTNLRHQSLLKTRSQRGSSDVVTESVNIWVKNEGEGTKHKNLNSFVYFLCLFLLWRAKLSSMVNTTSQILQLNTFDNVDFCLLAFFGWIVEFCFLFLVLCWWSSSSSISNFSSEYSVSDSSTSIFKMKITLKMKTTSKMKMTSKMKKT